MKRPAYPSIENTIRELLRANNPTYEYFIRYLSRYPDNTWKYMLEHELKFMYDMIYNINNSTLFYFVLDKTSYNYKFSDKRNIYHILSYYDLIGDINNLEELIKIIDRYFTEDINKLNGGNESPMDIILDDKYIDDFDIHIERSKKIIKIFHDNGAIITNKLLKRAKELNLYLYEYIMELSYPDVKYPGYD